MARFDPSSGDALATAQSLGASRLVDLGDGRGDRPLNEILAEADKEIAAAAEIMKRALAEFEGPAQ